MITFIAVLILFIGFVNAQFPVTKYSYKYAKSNRFQPSEIIPFDAASKVTTYPSCFQAPNQGLEYSNFSEDCLYLDIWIPEIAKTEKLPIVLWIHGGHFVFGSNRFYNASEIANSGSVIVVSAQYRLGLFGFAPFEVFKTQQGYGNLGLLDQINALKWIKQNLPRFNGDVNRITILGQDAGAFSVNTLQAFVKDDSLFHRTISLSGVTLTNDVKTPEIAKAHEKRLIELFNCDDPEEKKVAHCLQELSPYFIVNVTASQISHTLIGPMIDGVFITKSLKDQYQNLDFLKVPSIVGSTKDEFNTEICSHKWTLDEFKKVLNALFKDVKEDVIMNFYNITKTESDYAPHLGRISNDWDVHCPTRKHALSLSKKETLSYFYTFGHKLSIATDCQGSYHNSELVFLFPSYFQDTGRPAYKFDDDEATLSDNIIQFFSNFAYSGNPNARLGGMKEQTSRKLLQCFYWNPYDAESDFDMYFDVWGLVDRRKHFYESVCNFWENLH